MTKKQLTEKWQDERSKAAGEASKLNAKAARLEAQYQRERVVEKARTIKGELNKTKNLLGQMAARVVTIDQFLNDI